MALIIIDTLMPITVTCKVTPQSQKYANGLERVELYVDRAFTAQLPDKPRPRLRVNVIVRTKAGTYHGGLRTHEKSDKVYLCPDLVSESDSQYISLAKVLKNVHFGPGDKVEVEVEEGKWTILRSMGV